MYACWLPLCACLPACLSLTPLRVYACRWLFHGLNDAVLGRLCTQMVLRRVPAGSRLFDKGRPLHGMFVVLSGQMRLFQPATPADAEQQHAASPPEGSSDALSVGSPRRRLRDMMQQATSKLSPTLPPRGTEQVPWFQKMITQAAE